MTSLGFIGPPKIYGPSLDLAPPQKKKLFFCTGPPPPNYFGLKFLGPRLKLGGAATSWSTYSWNHIVM